MKIEKISDNQIRCILSREDLEQRSLRLSELAYGNEKARALFRDIMQQAAFQYGFKTDGTPLMIEAIPLGNGSIILLVTKVENPEELDTRFSNFAPSVQSASASASEAAGPDPLLQAMRENFSPPPVKDEKEEIERYRMFLFTNRIFRFEKLEDAIRAAVLTADAYQGDSSLYRDDSGDCYYLSLTMEDADAVGRMQRVLSVISEYGSSQPVSIARRQHLNEHCKMLCARGALAMLSQLE
ncbi:MAG: adaptor protein MecA [Lachnospiraceae bacterium]|nr:adaptor protein MecA [Lachnospiraceae bacterium]